MCRSAFTSALLLGALLVVAPCVQAAGKPGTGEPVSHDEARKRFKALSKVLRGRGVPAALGKAAFDDVAAVLLNPGGDTSQRERSRRSASRGVAAVLTAWRADPRAPTVNTLEPLVVHASLQMGKIAAALPAKERRKLSGYVMRDIQKALKRRKPAELSSAWLDAALGSLSHLRDESAFTWLEETFIHTKSREVKQIVAAVTTLHGFDGVSGALRRRLFEKTLRTYEPIEAGAQRGAAGDETARRLWGELRLPVIALLQKLSHAPRNEKGEALSTLVEFRRWWQDHKDGGKAPWKKAGKKSP